LADAARSCGGLPGRRFRIEDLWIASSTRVTAAAAPERAMRRGSAEANREWYERDAAALRELGVAFTRDSVDGVAWFTAEVSPATRRLALPLWRLRRLVGKLFSVLRLAKGALTFEGAIDYALWKIVRHSGSQVDTNWRAQRFPLLALARTFLKLFREGAVR
jgi:hypothetical protein